MDRTKKVLITLLVVGALATVGVGTYATFTAQTTNAGNTFTTGTIVLSDQVGSGTVCYSAGAASGTIAGGNVNNGCAAVAFATLAKPGDSAPSNITLTNKGSLAAGSGLTVSAGSCADTAGGGTFNADPTGNPLCGALGIQIQDYTAGFGAPNAHCVYPFNATTACGTNFGTLAGLTNITAASSLASGSSVYDQVTVNLPLATGNSVQGLTSTFNLTWTLSQ